MDNPTAPIGHHWQDATHISFGVLTAGLFTHRWKLEGSAFNGREPDGNRWDFDRIRLDSYSGRVTFNPDSNWSLTAGYGHLKSPEALEPSESVHRVAASAIYGAALGTSGEWSASLIYGGNKVSKRSGLANALLLESEAVLDPKNTLLGRVELVQKSADELVLDVPPAGFAPKREFSVGAATLGYVREVAGFQGATIGIGVSGTLNVVPGALEEAYGSRTPVAGILFVRLRPTLKLGVMTGMGAMHMHHMNGG
jgi:hypothetical protein